MTKLTLTPLLDEGCRALVNYYFKQHYDTYDREKNEVHLCRALALIPNLFDRDLHAYKKIFLTLLRTSSILPGWDGVFDSDLKKSFELIKKISAYAEDNKLNKDALYLRMNRSSFHSYI